MAAEIYFIFICKWWGENINIFSNPATSIAMSGKEIIVIDNDLAMPNIGLVFGMIDPPANIHDVFDGSEPIERAFYERTPQVEVFQCSLGENTLFFNYFCGHPLLNLEFAFISIYS